MATTRNRARCTICNKDKSTMRCGGCLQEFCYSHMGDHRQDLNKQLDEIEVNRDLFRQSLTQHCEKPNNHILIQQVNQWEQKSIKIIKKTAEDARQLILKNTTEYINQLEIKLNKLTEELRHSRNEDDFDEIILSHFQEQLEKLTKELNQPSYISIREESTMFISKISVRMAESRVPSNIRPNTKWIQNGITVIGGNGCGNKLNQLNAPCGMYINDEQNIFIADCANHRIVKWKNDAITGQIVAGGNDQGNKLNQLNYPRDIIIDKKTNNLLICDRDNRRIMQWSLENNTQGQILISNIDCSRLTTDKDGYIYVSDYKKHEVRRWKIGDTKGILVAGGNGQGNNRNQLNEPTFIFVDDDYSVYVSDNQNHRVMKWIKGATEGIIVAGGQGQGNNLEQLSGPAGLLVDNLGTVYVADCYNHRVMRWYQGAAQGHVIMDENRAEDLSNQLSYPGGLSFDQQGNIYVVDYGNNRVQRFDIDQS